MGNRLVVPLLVLALAASSAVLAAEEASQSWFLKPDGATRAAPAGPSVPRVVPDTGATARWVADVAAVASVDLSGVWTYSLEVPSVVVGTFVVEVGRMDAGASTFTPAGSGSAHAQAGTTVTGSLATLGFLVAPGEWLAFLVRNTDDALGSDLDLRENHPNTWFASPLGDPGYPTPELPSLALAAAGLAGLTVARAWRRRPPPSHVVTAREENKTVM